MDPKDIVCVSVMPCTAKKFEIGRKAQNAAGVPDVDIAITTRELARLINVQDLILQDFRKRILMIRSENQPEQQ